MNYGMLHNRRPKKGKEASSGINLKSITKQMGIDPKTMGEEAENMWNMLNDLSINDPQAYLEFIQSQLKEGPPMKPSDSSRSFIPQIGFVVKTMILNDLKLFMNCCSHDAIDMPKDPQDRLVPVDPRDLRFTSNLQIPLAIGSRRLMKDKSGSKCYAIDVVFHPWIMKRLEWDKSFKGDVIKLAMNWVEKEQNCQLKFPGKIIKSLYKGASEYNSQKLPIPVPFFIPNVEEDYTNKRFSTELGEQGSPSVPKLSSKQESTIETKDPNHLLQQIRLENPEELKFDLRLSSCSSKTRSRPLIEEIPVISTSPSQDHLNTATSCSLNKPLIGELNVSAKEYSIHSRRKKPKQEVILKGFLSKGNVSLYPSGSTEGRPPSDYIKLLSRSKVVDMNKMSEGERRAILSSSKTISRPDPCISRSSEENGQGDIEFEKLCEDVDPELGRSSGQMHDLDVFDQQLRTLAESFN